MRLAALAFLGGVLLVQQGADLPSIWWGVLALPCLLLAYHRPRWLLGAFFVAGLVWASFRAELILDDALPTALEGRELIVEGHVADIPQSFDYGERFLFDIESAYHDGQQVSAPRRVLLSLRSSAFEPRAGERWRFTVRLTRPHGLQNPGAFDYEAYLFRQRIRARGYVRADPPAEQLGAARARYAIDRTRHELGERIGGVLAGHSMAPVVIALANGDARGLREEQWQTLRATGTLHLVAITGLHISLVAAVAFFL
ncbi:MAG: ComEC/Rec2 family competence protein, partial [Betaproteobacteria bacterium]